LNTVPAKTELLRPHSASAPTLRGPSDLFAELDEFHALMKNERALKPSASLQSNASKSKHSLPQGATNSDLVWRGVEQSVAKADRSIRKARATTAEGRQRAVHHRRKEIQTMNRIGVERKRIVSKNRAVRKQMQQAAQAALFELGATRPHPFESGGLYGKERANWHMYMNVHCQIVKTATPAVDTKLSKHVKRQRREMKEKKAKAREGQRLDDAGLTGKERIWWRKQRALHDRVVQSATSKTSQELPKHVKEEILMKRKKLEQKYARWNIADGGLEGSAKAHAAHMRALHERVVSSAKASVDVKLPKHVVSYRSYLAEQRRRPKTENLHEKALRVMHEKVVANAKGMVQSRLGKHTEHLREHYRRNHREKFARFDPNDGGLRGKERKHWRIMRAQHDGMIISASPKIENKLPKHVLKRTKELKKKTKKKYENWSLEDGGLFGNERAHWHVMRELHDRVVGKAQSAVNVKLEPHIENLRELKRKKSEEKFSVPHSAGLSVKEQKHWQALLEAHDKVVRNAEVQVEAKLDKFVARMRKLKQAKLQGKIDARNPEDGGLEGAELHHWKVMRELHDHVVGSATAAVKTKLDPHVLRYNEHVYAKSRQKYARMTNEDALLVGPELDWWIKQRRVHDALVRKAKASLDCWQGGQPKTTNELIEFPRRVKSNREKASARQAAIKAEELLKEKQVVKALKVVEDLKENGELAATLGEWKEAEPGANVGQVHL